MRSPRPYREARETVAAITTALDAGDAWVAAVDLHDARFGRTAQVRRTVRRITRSLDNLREISAQLDERLRSAADAPDPDRCAPTREVATPCKEVSSRLGLIATEAKDVTTWLRSPAEPNAALRRFEGAVGLTERRVLRLRRDVDRTAGIGC